MNHVSYFPAKFKSWGEALAEHGWLVGYTAKGWSPGVALDIQGRPRQMSGRAFNARESEPPTTGIKRNDYAANFDDVLDQTSPDKPWCF